MINYETKFTEEEFKGLQYSTPGSAAVDLRAWLPVDKWVTLPPGGSHMFDFGIRISMEFMVTCAGFIYPRSGFGAGGVGGMGGGIVLTNSVGVIDKDYRGSIKCPLVNRTEDPFRINHGDRVAQLVIMPIIWPTFNQVGKINTDTTRGTDGFGSTGVS